MARHQTHDKYITRSIAEIIDWYKKEQIFEGHVLSTQVAISVILARLCSNDKSITRSRTITLSML